MRTLILLVTCLSFSACGTFMTVRETEAHLEKLRALKKTYLAAKEERNDPCLALILLDRVERDMNDMGVSWKDVGGTKAGATYLRGRRQFLCAGQELENLQVYAFFSGDGEYVKISAASLLEKLSKWNLTLQQLNFSEEDLDQVIRLAYFNTAERCVERLRGLSQPDKSESAKQERRSLVVCAISNLVKTRASLIEIGRFHTELKNEYDKSQDDTADPDKTKP